MARLPDLPIGVWLSDQASRFADATAGYFPALEFEDGAKQAESIIPPDYPLPGGPDQWQAAEQQRIEDELRRNQQEEEERKRQQEQADLARREQELRAQQVAEEQRSQDQGQQATSWAQQLGIPTPDEVFSGFSNLAQRPTDNLSTTGSFERQAPEPTPEPTPEPPAIPQSPVDQFTSWAQGLTAPLFREHTYADSVREAQDRPPEPARAAPSTTGILDTLGSTAETLGNMATGAGRALYEGGKAAVEEWQQPQALGQTGLPPDVLGPMTRGAGVVRKAGEAAVDSALRSASGGLGASAEPYHYGTIPETVPAQVPGIGGRTIPLVGGQDVDFSQQDVVAGVGSQLLDPLNYLGVPAAVKAGRLAPELIRSLPGVGETELLFQGGRGLARRASEALSHPSRGASDQGVQLRGSGVVPEASPVLPNNAAARGITALYHETDPRTALGLTNEIGTTGLDNLYVSPDPTLALGQGGRGARIEFGNTEQIGVIPARRKPGALMMEATGEETPEYVVQSTLGRPAEYIRSITLAPDARMDVVSRSQARGLQRDGWQVETLADGSRRFTPPVPLQGAGSGVAARLTTPVANAAQGAVFGAASENLQAQQEGRDVDYGEQAKRALIGGVLGYGAGRFGPAGARALGQEARRLGSGVTPNPPGTPPLGGFRTAKGSEYVLHGDGTTVRNKAARSDVGHEGDSGLKPQSDKTYFLTPENARRLAPPQGSVRIIDHGDGTISLATKTPQGRWGIAPSQRDVPHEVRPQVGLQPLEVWTPSVIANNPAYSDTHFGNLITEVWGDASRIPPRIPTPPDVVSNPPGTPPGVGAATPPRYPRTGPQDDFGMPDLKALQVDPQEAAAAAANAQKIRASQDKVRSGEVRVGATPDDVQQLNTTWQAVKREFFDRHGKLSALGRRIAKLRGQDLDPEEDAWALARLYEGAKDVAYARMERMLPGMKALSKEGRNGLNEVAQALDDADTDEVMRWRAQQPILRNEPEGTPSVERVRQEGEARLERRRAQAQHRLARKELRAATQERDHLLGIMRATGEGPTHGVETDYQAFQRGFRGFGPPRRMETPRSEAAEARFAAVQDRLEKAEAEAARTLENMAKSKQQSLLRQVDRQTERAATRAEEVGTSRAYSGGASPQAKNAIWADIVARYGPKEAEKIQQSLRELYTFRDAMRERYVAAGMWDQETADFFKNNMPNYSPTRILQYIDPAGPDALQAGAKSFSVGSNDIKHLSKEGTELERMLPTRALLEMGFKMEERAQRNQVMRAVAKWADEPGMENFVRRISSDEKPPPGYKPMSAFEDGEHIRLAVHDSIADSLELIPPGQTGLLGGVLNALRAPLQMGTTALRPAFIFTNAINDALLTLFRFTVESPNPVEAIRGVGDLFKGYHEAFGAANLATQGGAGGLIGAGTTAIALDPNDPQYWQKVAAGGAAGLGVGLSRRAFKTDPALIQRMREAGASMGVRGRYQDVDNILRQLHGERINVRTVENKKDLASLYKDRVLGQGSDILGMAWSRPLSQVSTVVESAPRIAAFARAERQAAGKARALIRDVEKMSGQKVPDTEQAAFMALAMQDVLPEAAMAARRATVDFAAGGRSSKIINQLSPFFNAATQATVEGFDMMRKHPQAFAGVMATIIGTIAATEVHNRSLDPEAWADVSRYTRDSGLVVLSDEPPEGEGKRGILYIPLRGVPGMMVPMVRAAMGKYFGDDKRTWDRLAREVLGSSISQISPVQADIGGLVGMMAPPLAAQAMELISNYDSFRDQPIVSRSMEGLPSTEQYDSRTSQLARLLSRTELPGVGGASPLKLDWLLRNMSPGPGEAAISVADSIIRGTGQELPTTERNVPKGVRDIPWAGPIAGRVLRTVGSERQNQAYEQADELAAKNTNEVVAYVQRSPAYQSATPDRQRQMLRSAQTALTEQAQELVGVNEFKQPKNLGLPPRFEGVQAGSRLEGEVGSALAKSRKNQSARERFLVQQYGRRETRAWTKLHTAQDLESQQLRSAVRTLVRE